MIYHIANFETPLVHHGMVTFTKLGQKKIDMRESRIKLSESMAQNDDQVEHFINVDNEALEW